MYCIYQVMHKGLAGQTIQNIAQLLVLFYLNIFILCNNKKKKKKKKKEK